MGSNPGFVVTCGLRFLLVISLAPEGFSQSSPDFYSPYKQHYRIPVQFAMDPGTTVAYKLFSSFLEVNKRH